MKKRCHNPKISQWKDYGGRGIKVCERWKVFANFLMDMGVRPSSKHSLDRIDVNGNYEPSNCRWSTFKEQQRNRRNNRLLTFNGETKCLADWAEIRGISTGLLWARLNMGWSIKRSIETPASSYVEMYTHNGKTQSVRKWAIELGLSPQLLHQRRTREGWPLEKALFTPIRVRGKH